MSEKRKRRNVSGRSRVRRVRSEPVAAVAVEGLDDAGREKYFQILIISVLLLFGIYQSVLYIGHQVVPNSDFPAFVGVARPLLSFDLPGDFKRVPGLGLLQIGMSKFVGGQYPELTGGWLLNAILHPLNLLLLYLVGRKVLNGAAVWFAIVAILNPWTLAMLVQPIVETALIFFTLLTFFFMLRRSGWCYVFASMATMVRYEGAALIFAAFVLDVIESGTWKQRGVALLKSVAAAIPLGLWLLASYLHKSGTGGGNGGDGGGGYLGQFGRGTYFGEFTNLLWQVTFSSLFAATSKEATDFVFGISKVIAVIGIGAGCVFGILKRKHEVWVLLLFLVPYYLANSLKINPRDRYCIPIAWVTLLLCLYGFKCLWDLLSGKLKIPKAGITILQVVMLIVAVIWAAGLVSFLPSLATYSARSASVPFVAMVVVMVITAGYAILFRTRGLMTCAATAGVICLMVLSNQFKLAMIMGNGDRDIEFKLLADWYVAEADEGEKLVTTMPHVVRIFAPKHRDRFVATENIKGDGLVGFLQACYDKKITYVAWDSRLGLIPQNSYYKKYGLDRIAMLGRGNSVGRFEFIKQIRHNKNQFINIYRLRTLKLPQGNNANKPSTR